jgi:hypothetical protein
MSDHLYLTQKEYENLRMARKDVPAHSILLLSQELEIDPENLSYGRLDYKAFELHQGGKALYIPERYSIGAFSTRATSLPILEYSDLHLGEGFTDSLLRKLQIRRTAFEFPNEKINILFPTDAFDFFMKLGQPKNVLFQMGNYFTSVHHKTEIGQRLRQCDTVEKIYEVHFSELAPTLERNCAYSLSKSSSSTCVVEAKEKEEVLSALQLKHLGSTHTCIFKSGVLAGLPSFLDLPLASTLHTHCVHQGDSHCRYEVNFEYALAVHKKRLKAPNPKQKS